jgi:hypothetical protein
MKIRNAIFVIILFLSSCSIAQAATIQSDPSVTTVEVGDTFTVSYLVTVTEDTDTVAVDLLTWDKNVIGCIDVQQGDLFPSPLIWLSGVIQNSNGTLKNTVVASNVPVTDKIATYMIVTFRAKAAGSTMIQISGFGVARGGNALQRQILNNCTVTVSSSSVVPPVIPDIPDDVILNDNIVPGENATQVNRINLTADTIVNQTVPVVPIIPQVPSTTSDNVNEQQSGSGSLSIGIYFIVMIALVGLIVSMVLIRVSNKRKRSWDERFGEEIFESKR